MKKFKAEDLNISEFLDNDSIETAMLYLAKTFESRDPDLIKSALGDILKAKKLMSKIAKKINVSRTSLYKSLTGGSSPSFDTILKLFCELGIGLRPYKLSMKYKKAS